MTTWPAIPLALGAVLAFGLSSALKHLSTERTERGLVENGGRGALAFVRQTIRQPLWLAGIAADVIGLGLQVVALHIGGLLLVQPLLVSALVGALVVRSRFPGGHLSRRQATWSLALVLALAIFVTAVQAGGINLTPTADRLPSFVLSGIGLVLIVGALAVARWGRSQRVAASVLGSSAGLLYAAAAALVTLVSIQFTSSGLMGVVRRDEIYVLIGVGIAGQVLGQAAFHAGSLAASAPSAATADLLASVLLGIVVFDHRFPTTPLHLATIIGSLLVVIVAVFMVTASDTQLADTLEPHVTRPL